MLSVILLATTVLSFGSDIRQKQCPAPVYLGARHGCSKTFIAQLTTANVVRPEGYENLDMGTVTGSITLCVVKKKNQQIKQIRYHLSVPGIKYVVAARLTVEDPNRPNGRAVANLITPRAAGNKKVGIEFWGVLKNDNNVFPFTTIAEVADAIEKEIAYVLVRTDDGAGNQNTGPGGNF